MPKRILLSKFRFYVNLYVFPILLISLIMLIFPEGIKVLRIDNELYSNRYFLFFVRVSGLLLFHLGISIYYYARTPNKNIDLFFFTSLLLLGLAFLLIIAPFLWKFSYLFFIVALFFLVFGIFFFIFSTKNLLVRD